MIGLRCGVSVLAAFGVCFSFSTSVSAQTVFTWQESVQEAREHNPDLAAGREAVIQSQADKSVVISSFLPQVDGQAAAVRTKLGTGVKSDTYSYEVSGSQLVFDGFKTVFDLKAASRNLTAAEYAYLVISSNVRLRLRNAFIELLKEQELVKITDDIVKRRKDSLELVNLRYEGGREHKGALLTAEANLAQAEAEAAQARRRIELGQRSLNKELGRVKFSAIEAGGSFDVAHSAADAPDLEDLAETTPFLKELIARKEAARFSLNSTRAEYFPAVFVTSDIGRSDDTWPADRDSESWSAGVRVTIPILTGGSRRANIKKARSVLKESQAAEQSGRDSVILTLYETWTDLQDALDQVRVQGKFLEAAQARAKISESQYSNGLIAFDDWIIIEDNLVRTRKSFLQAQTDALLAEAQWIQAKGGTLENEK